ncbi:MAG: Gfo/Idh/MocA family oxidoreductase [Bryobacterales bacterium]
MASNLSRRTFLGGAGALGLAAAAGPLPAAVGPNDRIRVGMVAVGARAQQLLEAIQAVEGTEIVSVCDAYTGRIERAIERTGGKAKKVRDHREILADNSIDAVTIATPDHLHKRHVIEALEAGKDVYCEKPLTYTIDEGLEIIAAVKKSGKMLQVGSQGISSMLQNKARDIIQSGKLGKVTLIRASYNRNTASGAWIYPIPPDASPQTVNWDMFQGSAKKRPFDLERFFRWRCYEEYSGGIATDLFVHLCTTIHHVMNAKMPSKVVAMGQLYRWKESRDVPDTINAVLEYPEGFAVNLSSTFNNQSSAEAGFQILGTEGTLTIGYSQMRFAPERVNEDNGWITDSWASDLQKKYNQDPKIRQEEQPWTNAPEIVTGGEQYTEVGQGADILHMANFFKSVRTRQEPNEPALIGHRAAACAHLINDSSRKGQMTFWDFEKERQKS